MRRYLLFIKLKRIIIPVEYNKQKDKINLHLSKVKLGLCITGLLICVGLVAAVPHFVKGSLGPRPVSAGPSVNGISTDNLGNALLIQAAAASGQNPAAAGQGSRSALQGSVITANLPVTDPSAAGPAAGAPVPQPAVQEKCYPGRMYPMEHCAPLFCPEFADPCNSCGKLRETACLIE
jgi:type IV secretory pathway TrbL component